jgi:hypothetical protein
MSRRTLSAALVVAALLLSTTTAVTQAANPFSRILRISNEQPAPVAQPQPVSQGAVYGGYVADGAGFGALDAPLYPSPRQDVPREVGYTVITNQALYPHEMTYPHKYRALYPPYYYKQRVIPFLPAPPLKGTEVTVKYHSRISPTALFYAPKRCAK